MSADRWRICPRCHKKRIESLGVGYGSVSEKEYIASLIKKPEPEEETLREDYEIWTDEDGKFTVSYGCSCEVCGFQYEFSKEDQLDL